MTWWCCTAAAGGGSRRSSRAWARATGQDDTLDPGAVALLLPWAEANAALLEASGLFGSPIDTGPGAPDDARLLGLLGRTA